MPLKRQHICKRNIQCRCSTTGESPDDRCPEHGLGGRTRCIYCGKFMSNRMVNIYEEAALRAATNDMAAKIDSEIFSRMYAGEFN